MTLVNACRRAGVGRQVVLFAFFGAVQLAVDWLAFVLLTWAGVHVGVANLSGRVSGALAGYWLNGRFTFGASARPGVERRMQAARFLIGWLTTAGLSTAAVWLVEQQVGLHAAWISKLAIDLVIAVLGFVLSKYWIFR
ncbi:MAG: GtrA family protein [Pseudomonadota bacterium]